MTGRTPELRLVSPRPALAEQSIGALVHLVLEGSEPAAKLLYERTCDMVNGLAYRLLGTDQDLDDVVQEVYVTAFTNLARLREPQAFPKWVGTIVVRTVQHRFAKRSRRTGLGMVQGLEVDPDLMVSETTPPDTAAEIRHLYRTVAVLDPDERIALLLKWMEGYSVQEIAEVTESSASTVRRRLAAAEMHLSRALEGDVHG